MMRPRWAMLALNCVTAIKRCELAKGMKSKAFPITTARPPTPSASSWISSRMADELAKQEDDSPTAFPPPVNWHSSRRSRKGRRTRTTGAALIRDRIKLDLPRQSQGNSVRRLTGERRGIPCPTPSYPRPSIVRRFPQRRIPSLKSTTFLASHKEHSHIAPASIPSWVAVVHRRVDRRLVCL